jgi:hypothetical protein
MLLNSIIHITDKKRSITRKDWEAVTRYTKPMFAVVTMELRPTQKLFLTLPLSDFTQTV